MQPSEDLRRALLSLYAAMSSGDASAVEAHYSLEPGSVFIGTDASEFWTDSRQHNADVRPYFDGSHGRNQWRADDPIALSDGDTGWTIDRPSIRFASGVTLSLRLTLIWRFEDGEWKVVHSHASVGGAG